jgi:CHRD domain/PEP-CTERM motif
MKTRNALLALVVLLVVHGSARSDFIATATLTGGAEDTNSPGTGYGTVIYNAAAQTLTVKLTFSGLEPTVPPGTPPGTPAGTAIPPGIPGAAHIHFGVPTPPGGPILFPFIGPYANDFPLGVTSDTAKPYVTTLTPASLLLDTANGINGITFAEAVNDIEAGETYFNIHTVMFPGGEIAGQITVVPEPASLTLLTLGLGGILAIARFRRRRLAA